MGVPGCDLEWAWDAGRRESVWHPTWAGWVEWHLLGRLLALWHPGLWHILVSEVLGGAGGGTAWAFVNWALGGVGEAADVGAGAEAAGEVWAGLESVKDGVGVAVQELGAEQQVGPWLEEGEETGGGAEHESVVGSQYEGALAPEGRPQAEAQAGCLE